MESERSLVGFINKMHFTQRLLWAGVPVPPVFDFAHGALRLHQLRLWLLPVTLLTVFACNGSDAGFNAQNPARGHSELLAPSFDPPALGGGSDAVPVARQVTVPAPRADSATNTKTYLDYCDGECRSYCAAQNFNNPVNKGVCVSLWGVGLSTKPINPLQACRRLYADVLGRFPAHAEIENTCLASDWEQTVKTLLTTDEFVRVNRRLWADRLMYDTEAVSVERIFDIDALVSKLYQGTLAFDAFAEVVSAHPVLTRRYSTSQDRAEALFNLFLGRPPFSNERSDIARLYNLWDNHYYDHPLFGMRLPDAFVRYRCLTENNEIDPETAGECTSIHFGFEQVILKPDSRALQTNGGEHMWSGFLSADEWKMLQAPGRIVANEWVFWEQAVNQVLEQYLGYDLATLAPEVGEELARYFVEQKGNMVALHYAVLTSHIYLQSSSGSDTTGPRYTYGPLKQAEAETWVDSLDALTQRPVRKCDLRINQPRDFLDANSPSALALVASSDWELQEEGNRVRSEYRDLVRTLGGCPDHSQGGRFKVVSVLGTASQLDFAGKLCDPALEGSKESANVRALLPSGVESNAALTSELAAQIFDVQSRRFFSRPATDTELAEAREHGLACAATQCTAEQFARPTCFALLSSAEMLFY